jgi:hypothetical protein
LITGGVLNDAAVRSLMAPLLSPTGFGRYDAGVMRRSSSFPGVLWTHVITLAGVSNHSTALIGVIEESLAITAEAE